MKPVSELWQDDPDLAKELLEERAAIIAEGVGCTQYLGELTAAKHAGFDSWMDALMKIGKRKRELARARAAGKDEA